MNQLIITILCAACTLCGLAAQAAVKPNFFVINIDDLGCPPPSPPLVGASSTFSMATSTARVRKSRSNMRSGSTLFARTMGSFGATQR